MSEIILRDSLLTRGRPLKRFPQQSYSGVIVINVS